MDDKTQTDQNPEQTPLAQPNEPATVVEPNEPVVVSPEPATPEPAVESPAVESVAAPVVEPSPTETVEPAPPVEAPATPAEQPAMESPSTEPVAEVATPEAPTASPEPVAETPEAPVEPIVSAEPVASAPTDTPPVEPVDMGDANHHPAEVAVAPETTAALPAQMGKNPFVKGVWVMAGIIAGLLMLRFVLHLLAVDPNNFFVDKLYTFTHPLVAPFFAMFKHTEEFIERRFEYEDLIAIVFFGLVAWWVVTLTKFFSKKK